MKICKAPVWGVTAVVLLFSCKTVTREEYREPTEEKVKNIILLIGDGMGVAQIYAGMTKNKGSLYLEQFRSIGFVKTHSSNNFITDSGAAATAFACGIKTRNGMIGMNPDSIPVKSILEIAEEKGLSTGLVSTSTITHATPASFIAHQVNRNMYEEIAADFLNTDIDLFIGGGLDHFTRRADGRNLAAELNRRGYQVLYSMDDIRNISQGRLAGFTAGLHNPKFSEGRGNNLPDAVSTALKILGQNDTGFFLMAEGSMIDWGAHANETDYVAGEMIDFGRAVGRALAFTEKEGQTLVVVTADHETGGMALTGGDPGTGVVTGAFVTKDHTGELVPVFAFGPGADEFTGIYENTEIFYRMARLLGFEINTLLSQ